jgi:MoxR-like ATPase
MPRNPVTTEEVQKVIGRILLEVEAKETKTVELDSNDLRPFLNLGPGEQSGARIKHALKRYLQKENVTFTAVGRKFTFTVAGATTVKSADAAASNDDDAIVSNKTFTEFDTEYIADPNLYTFCKKAVDMGAMPLVVGPPGCGKSRMWEEIAKDRGSEAIRFAMDQVEDPADLIGKDQLVTKTVKKDGMDETVVVSEFVPGLLLQCFINGVTAILDEVDRASEAAVKSMNMLAEKGGKMVVLTEKGVKVFPRHPDARVCFSANTWGRGDDTGFFQGAMPINKAWLSRIGPKFFMDYDSEIERELLRQKNIPDPVLDILFKENNSDPEQEGIVLAIRRAIDSGKIQDYLTTRSLLRFADFYKVFGWNRAMYSCVLVDFEEENHGEVENIITRKAGNEGKPSMDTSFITKSGTKRALSSIGLA